jgi:hypothetical protein
MKDHTITFKNSGTGKTVFTLSILSSGFWWLGQAINIYHYAAVGAIFELLWLPVVAMLFVLPIISVVMLVKEKFNARSLYLYAAVLCITTILFMVLSK